MPSLVDAAETAPLDGLVVADFSRVLAGPLATMMLADLGAQVIKVERPEAGDDTRSWGPPFSASGSTYFDSVNRNKQSVTLNLDAPNDLALAHQLVARADVVIENFRPGTMERYGLGYAEASARNPRLVYASITGFGREEGANLPGYDFVVQALGGLMSITGEPDRDPMKAGVALVDVLAGKDACIGILAAVARRHATGHGSRIDVNLLSSLQGALVNQAQAYLGADEVPVRRGNVHPSIAPYQLLQCSDGPLAVACGNDAQFAKLCDVLGVAALAGDARFRTNSARVGNREALVAELEDALSAGTMAHWKARFERIGVPAGPVSTIADGIELANELGLQPTIDVHDSEGRPAGRQVRHPISWVPALPPRSAAPPKLGEHNDVVRQWLASGADTTTTAKVDE